MSPYVKSYIHEHSDQPEHGPVYRSHFVKNHGGLIIQPNKEVNTLYESLNYAINKFQNKICFGSRKVIAKIEEVKDVEVKEDSVIKTIKKTWSYYKLSPYEWITYNQLKEDLNFVGCALKHLGLNQDNKLAVYAPTSHRWSTIVNACYTQSITATTIYDTLGESGLKHGLLECDITTLFLGKEQISTLSKILKELPKLKCLITSEPIEEFHTTLLREIKPDLSIYNYDELMELGKANVYPQQPPKPSDIALIMYTSGTTGVPKGVVITHSNLVAIVAAISKTMEAFLNSEDIFISFLPLAHILAFAVDCYTLFNGIQIGYSSPRTLTDTNVRECQGDLMELKPTLIVGVPQIFDMIRKGVLNKIYAKGLVSKSIFDAAYFAKDQLSNYGLPTYLLDKLIFDKVKQQLGGRLKLAITGGAPISEETRNFFSKTVTTLIQGYGLTEICGVGFVTTPDMLRPECIGQMTPCNEFKLVDVPEANYFHTSDPPQGELWVRGASVAKGYYKQEAATKEAFTEDGWFRTGDIVEMFDNGSLKMVDRIKNLVKLSHGEYIALEKLEKTYKNSLLVQNCCIYADGLKNRPIALVFPNLDAVNARLDPNDKVYDLVDASKSIKVKKLIYDDLILKAKQQSFISYEIIADVILTGIEWNSENGLLTTSQKIRRKVMKERFDDEITQAYNNLQ